MNYTQAFNILMSLEFSRPEKALHKNPTENALTQTGKAGSKLGQLSTHTAILKRLALHYTTMMRL